MDGACLVYMKYHTVIDGNTLRKRLRKGEQLSDYFYELNLKEENFEK